MKIDSESCARLTDEELLTRVRTLAAHEREATAALIASLAELDARRLYLGEGFSSLFTYCTQALHLSEHAAYNRIEAARISRKWPALLKLVADGSVTLTNARLLASSLTDANHRQLFDAVRHKSKREVEQLVPALHPQPPVPSTVRRLPAPKPAPSSARVAGAPTTSMPLSPAQPDRTLAPAHVSGPALPSRQALIAPLARSDSRCS